MLHLEKKSRDCCLMVDASQWSDHDNSNQRFYIQFITTTSHLPHNIDLLPISLEAVYTPTIPWNAYRLEDGSIPSTRRMKSRSVAAPDPVLSTLPVMATWCPNKLILVGEQNSHHSLVPRPPLAPVFDHLWYTVFDHTGTLTWDFQNKIIINPHYILVYSIQKYILLIVYSIQKYSLLIVYSTQKYSLLIVYSTQKYIFLIVYSTQKYLPCACMHVHATWNTCGNQTSATHQPDTLAPHYPPYINICCWHL